MSGFVSVFEQRVALLRKKLKEELQKKKHERRKPTLKHIIKEIKRWEKIVKQHKKDDNRCPHCGKKI